MVREDGARSVEGVLSTGSAKSGCACGGRRNREKAGSDDLACSDGWDRVRLRAACLHRDEATQGSARVGAPREYGKAGPGRDYWIKEIREREADYVRRAEQAYERMVAAWKEKPLTAPAMTATRG